VSRPACRCIHALQLRPSASAAVRLPAAVDRGGLRSGLRSGRGSPRVRVAAAGQVAPSPMCGRPELTTIVEAGYARPERPGGSGAAETFEPRQGREAAAVRRTLRAPPGARPALNVRRGRGRGAGARPASGESLRSASRTTRPRGA